MDYQTLLGQLENHMGENDHYFKKIHNVLYFNDETFLHNPDFLNDNNNTEKTYTIEIRNLGKKNNSQQNNQMNIQQNEHKFFTSFMKNYFNIQKYNFSKEYTSITDCILSILDYKMANGKSQLFKKMLRENDSINFFNKFNFQKRKICKKKVLRDLLIKQDENNEIIIKFLCDYLNINLLILENNKYNLYSNNDEFELYKVTLVLYKYDGKFHYLIEKETNKQLFTSNDEINYKIKFNLFIRSIDFSIPINHQMENNNLNQLINDIESLNIQTIQEPIIETQEPIIDYNKMKIIELKKICKLRKIKGYSKLRKIELINILQ